MLTQKSEHVFLNQDATDLSSPNVSSLSQTGLYHQQHYISPPTPREVKENTAFSQVHRSLRNSEFYIDEQVLNQPAINCRMQSGTELNSAYYNSVSSLAPIQRKIQPPQNQAPQVLQHHKPATFSLNNGYQQISGDHVESKKSDQVPPDIPQRQTQHSAPQQQYQQPAVEIGLTSSIARAQPKATKLQKQDTNVQHDMSFRPKVLIKQSTVESYGSIEEISSDRTTTRNEQTLPSFSTQQQYGTTQSVSTPLSVNVHSMPAQIIQQTHEEHRTDPSLSSCKVQSMQMSKTVDYYAKEHNQNSKQPDPCPVTVQQDHTPVVPFSTVASIQSVPKVSGLTTQPIMECDQISKNQGFGAKIREPESSSTPAGSTSVKGLISLFSGVGSQPSVGTKPETVTPHHTQSVPISIDHKTHVPPTQAAFSHVAVTAIPSALSSSVMDSNVKETVAPTTPVMKTTPTLVSNQKDSSFKLPDEDYGVADRTSIFNSPTTQTKFFAKCSPLTIEGELAASSPSVLSKDPSAALKTELTPAPSLITESQNQEKGSTLCAVSPQASPTITPVVSSTHLATEIPGNEFPTPKSSPAKPSDTISLHGSLSKGGSVELPETLSEATSKACMSQQQSSEETKQAVSKEYDKVNTGFDDVSTVANISQEKTSHPGSIYIGINCSTVDMKTESDEPKPYVRLPHIFVSAVGGVTSPMETVRNHHPSASSGSVITLCELLIHGFTCKTI